jgi:hypothetical protein
VLSTAFSGEQSIEEVQGFIGAPEEIRTPDPQIRSGVILHGEPVRARSYPARPLPRPSLLRSKMTTLFYDGYGREVARRQMPIMFLDHPGVGMADDAK